MQSRDIAAALLPLVWNGSSVRMLRGAVHSVML